MIYPIKTEPVFKQYIWGGNTLKTKYNKNIEGDFAAESWEISCHKDGLSKISEGEYCGKTLLEVISDNPMDMIGEDEFNTFPLLVKILDANDRLSVQVHPDDEYAFHNENGEKGKTEMWYVIDAKPDAKLVYGLKPGTTAEDFKNAVLGGTVEDVLNFVPVKKGDSFFIGSGTIHAIGAGILIAEIQQSSNTTYRVYDYNRTDKDGNKRELHIQKAIDVTDVNAGESQNKTGDVKKIIGGTERTIAECEFFTVVHYECENNISLQKSSKTFEMLTFTEGDGNIIFNNKQYSFKSGDSFFIPAAMKNYSIEGKCTFLRSYIDNK